MKIRPASEADIDLIAAFNIALAHESENLALDLSTVRRGVAALLTAPSRGIYFVAEIDGAVVGQTMITFEWSDWRNGNIWWLQSVYVAASFRSRGVFRSLFAHITAEARRRSEVCGLRLYMDVNNTSARAVYQKMGLRQSHYVVLEQMFQADDELRFR